MGAMRISQDFNEPRHTGLERRLPTACHVGGDGYRCVGMPPNLSWVMIANGQQPTDSLCAGHLVKNDRTSGATLTKSQDRPVHQR